ncbi:FMN-dependent NADH-azoreductase [Marinoscillum furvescens]|uniref:FMN dependent NADH:quinone oxidoreductase n=1 Tax=Marinoscillum furvescens DSM 4134 TaxID=1122208 RepID=A0A3D9KY37_MARFU|nr:NAD(P)H-dependent oxidoreductase [Marinoscillum furvescens]RED92219.1 FMN-dependent NADH-azoreductase [Marinoscillum furvescens DSM 4134]
MKVLSIQSSASMDRSLTRQLSAQFIQSLAQKINFKLTTLDLVNDNPPFVTPEWIAGAFSRKRLTVTQKAALEKSDNYIQQVRHADLLIIGAPMYNYGMPAVLKAWIDQVARVNKTFSFDLSRGDEPIRPILSGKIAVVFTSSGEFDFQPGGSRSNHNHLVPHIKSCAHYLGVDTVKNFHQIGIEYQEFKDLRHEQSKARAFQQIPELVSKLI